MPAGDQLPRPIQDLYERGQRDGVFRADCPLEIAYSAAVAAIVALQIFVPPAPDAPTTRDQVIGQVLDGMTGPASRA